MSRTSVFLVVVILTVVATMASSKTIDEIIMESATRSEGVQSDFFPEGETGRDVLVELDMRYTRERWNEIQQMRNARGRGGRSKRKAVKGEKYRWPNGVIPYDFQSPDAFNSSERAQIDLAIQEWNSYTCVNLRPATSADSHRITFQDGYGCSSSVGRQLKTGSQAVTLGRGCRVKHVIVHEIGHAVGFQHEQSRPDRDRFVTIVEANIGPEKYHNFEIYSVNEVNNYDVPYDYDSVMHYGPNAFSVNGGITIVTKNPAFQNVIGNRKGLSFRDIKLANLMYNCGGSCCNIKCPGEGFLGKDCQCLCPGSPIRLCEGSTNGETVGCGSGYGESIRKERWKMSPIPLVPFLPPSRRSALIRGPVQESSCFPSNAELTTRDGPKTFRDIQVGDEVLGRDPQGKSVFTKVCHLTHTQPGTTMEVVDIAMESGARLQVSTRHYVAKDEDGLIYVLAETIKPGDKMRTCAGPGHPDLLDTVKAVSRATASGKHAILTETGNHYVNGVLASNYDDSLPHAWAHLLLNPIRFAFRHLPRLNAWLNNHMTVEGVPVWASVGKRRVVPLLPIRTAA